MKTSDEGCPLCGEPLIIHGEGPDEVRACPGCGAVWSMDSKED